MGRIRAILRRLRARAAVVSIETADGLTVRGEVQPGQSLLSVAAQLGVELDHFCGGRANCGSCRVEVLDPTSALSPVSARETLVLGASRVQSGDRLACQATVEGPVHIRAPRWF